MAGCRGVRVCVCVCVRACARACVRACVRARQSQTCEGTSESKCMISLTRVPNCSCAHMKIASSPCFKASFHTSISLPPWAVNEHASASSGGTRTAGGAPGGGGGSGEGQTARARVCKVRVQQARDTGAGHLQASAMIQDENSFNTVTHNRPSEGDWDGSGGPAGSCTAFSTPPTQESALMADQDSREIQRSVLRKSFELRNKQRQ